MDKAFLVEKDIEEGKEIINMLDAKGLFFPVALWLFYPRSNAWRLMLGKDDVKKIGAWGYYKKIQTMLNKLDPRKDINVANISVVSTDDEIARIIRARFKTGKKLSGIRLSQQVANGRLIPDAYVYRAARSAAGRRTQRPAHNA